LFSTSKFSLVITLISQVRYTTNCLLSPHAYVSHLWALKKDIFSCLYFVVCICSFYKNYHEIYYLRTYINMAWGDNTWIVSRTCTRVRTCKYKILKKLLKENLLICISLIGAYYKTNKKYCVWNESQRRSQDFWLGAAKT
jgi:hypothetical protein